MPEFFYGEIKMNKLDINNLTVGQVKEMVALFCSSNAAAETVEISSENVLVAPVKIGEAYLFRTVTHIEVGEVLSVDGVFITLKNASWIADTGRYHDCLANGVFNEVEPYPDTTTINSSSLINYAPWYHQLPKEQK